MRGRCLATATVISLALAIAPPSTAQDDEAEKTPRVVHIQKTMPPCEPDQEDCEAVKLRRILISSDGKVEEVDDAEWLDREGLLELSLTPGFEPRVLFAHWQGRGFLGVQVLDLTPDLRTHFGVPEEEGVLVSRLTEDSPAALAGVRVGDILSGIDGERVAGTGDLIRLVAGREPGTQIAVELWRDGKLQTVTVGIGERELPSRPNLRFFERRCEGGECEELEHGLREWRHREQ